MRPYPVFGPDILQVLASRQHILHVLATVSGQTGREIAENVQDVPEARPAEPRARSAEPRARSAEPEARSAELDELLPHRHHHGFHPRVDLELLQDVADVVLDGVLGDE
jgi:hypothetical protein